MGEADGWGVGVEVMKGVGDGLSVGLTVGLGVGVGVETGVQVNSRRGVSALSHPSLVA